MSDARALLRQQRAARRIEHPHASYTDSGRLLCTLCREAIKAESLWDGHLRSPAHRQRARAVSAARAADSGGPQQQQQQTSHKRKQDDRDAEDDSNEDGGRDQGNGVSASAAGPSDMDIDDGSAVPKKRSRPDRDPSPDEATTATGPGSVRSRKEGLSDIDASTPKTTSSTATTQTPPLTRRVSGTPAHGVEVQIPSRPATPNTARDGGSQQSAVSTPRIMPVGRSPLIPQEPVAGASAASKPAASTTTAAAAQSQAELDEAEWAAFEAEVVNAPATTTTTTTTTNGSHDAAVVISAAPMSAAEVAAKAEEEDRARQQARADAAQIADEREEAARALEDEFDEMEELEARVRRLKERREALRRGSTASVPPPAAAAIGPTVGDTADAKPGAMMAAGKENLGAVPENSQAKGSSTGAKAADNDEDDDEDEDEDEDDWAGFRFRA
ncbi:uncharacterized protein E0L32_005860 [Thyridium curvatum]|uniref:Coiled-coil domain-containing protein 16 n=1 Tax=Thyridium curvatum TaxID=1093900 RepID=A0A507B1R6_9PEZI|nr:uncharacterized protein E0L32_005860 [Thyridium curvatum]TPX13657.1 hypothetical protein E0L32_005860 [Thyridium curvatum]